ncbi:MAG: hypothetical protein PF508_14215, partial [Spirochaeta sp.]|nr:hypothetical protein [Spirochaeta sp.]
MSDRPVAGFTAIVVITMLVAAGCAGAPERAPTDGGTPGTERAEPAVGEDGADTEPRPDPGIAHVTVTPTRSDLVLPLPVIRLTGTPGGGRVDSGLVAPVPDLPDSPTRLALPPAVPEPSAMRERHSTDDLAPMDNREPSRQSPVTADLGPAADGTRTPGLAQSPEPAQTEDGEPAATAEPAAGQDRRAGPTAPREEPRATAREITASP